MNWKLIVGGLLGLLPLIGIRQNLMTGQYSNLVFGAFLMYGGFTVFRFGLADREEQQRKNRQRETHPDQPWTWDGDWENQRIRDPIRRRYTYYTLLAVLLTLLVVDSFMPSSISRHGSRPKDVVFPTIIAVLFWTGSRYNRCRLRKYGEAVLHLSSVPIEAGTTMQCVLSVLGLPKDDDEISVKLVGREIINPESKKKTSATLFTHEQTFKASDFSNKEGRFLLPIQVDIPSDARSRTMNPKLNVVWTLTIVSQEFWEGLDLEFDLPIYNRNAPAISS